MIVLSQIFQRNFPTYSVGATLVIPLRNRSAQADMATAQLQYRQTELGLQKAINQIRVDVQTALTALQQARAQYAAATKGVDLQAQTLDAEQKKLALGASTPYNVILIQRDLGHCPVVSGDRPGGLCPVPHSARSGDWRVASPL